MNYAKYLRIFLLSAILATFSAIVIEEYLRLISNPSPYEECFKNCEKIRVANGFSKGKYENNTCFCVFYIEAATVEYERVKNIDFIDLWGGENNR